MTKSESTRTGPVKWIRQQLRIDAIRDLFAMVELKRAEFLGLVAFAAIYAFTDGVGLSVLLPVLRYAEGGTVTFSDAGGLLWSWPGYLAKATGLPLNLVTLLIVAFIPVLLRQVTMYLNVWYSSLVSNRVAMRMRVNTFGTIMKADPDFFPKHGAGQLSGVVMGQTGVAGGAVLQVVSGLAIVFQLTIYVTMLTFLSLPLTLMAIAAGLAVSQLVRRNMTRARAYGVEVTEVSQSSVRAVIEKIALARLVKMRGQEAEETREIGTLSERLLVLSVKLAKLGAKTQVTADPLLMLSAFVTLYLGISVLGLRLAELGMLLYVLTRLNGKVKEINGIRQSISSSMAGLSLVREITGDAKAMTTITSGPIHFGGVKHSIELRDVRFQFDGAPHPTLRDVNALIEAGSFTALVGRSGAGKSTFVELLPRLRDVTSGSVLYDGVDIREFDLASLRTSIGYLTQTPMMFNASVRDNLLYGIRREVTDTEIARALEQAYASFVLDLPQGLETSLGDQGVRFSGGERQRIALARVLLDDPSVLVLDEPTSALDSESEQYIQDALTALHGQRTIIVIAHRLATVIASDQLLVVEDDQIVQRGTHSELVDAEGAYKHLFESQLLRG